MQGIFGERVLSHGQETLPWTIHWCAECGAPTSPSCQFGIEPPRDWAKVLKLDPSRYLLLTPASVIARGLGSGSSFPWAIVYLKLEFGFKGAPNSRAGQPLARLGRVRGLSHPINPPSRDILYCCPSNAENLLFSR